MNFTKVDADHPGFLVRVRHPSHSPQVIADTKIQVLLVEDNPTDKMLVEDELAHTTGSQFAVAHVDQLNDALARLGAERFDVVLLDLTLPDSNGFETFVRLHNAAPETPVVVLSGGADGQLAVQAVPGRGAGLSGERAPRRGSIGPLDPVCNRAQAGRGGAATNALLRGPRRRQGVLVRS